MKPLPAARSLLLFALFVAGPVACDDDDPLLPPPDGGSDGALPGDGALPPGDGALPPGDGAPPQTLVDVSHQRELRGVWVATVANIDFPTKQGLSAAAQKAELDAIVDTLAQARFNAVFFQVRPEGDALYASTLEPWSRYLRRQPGPGAGLRPLEPT